MAKKAKTRAAGRGVTKSKRSGLTLSQLGILLLLISLIVTAISIINILKVGGKNLLTGAITSGVGETNITITSTTSFAFPVTGISFGAGYVGNGTTCVMDSNGQHNQSGRNCYGWTNVTNGFYIENDGNLNLSINYTCSKNCSAASFIGGTDPRLMIRVKSAFTRNQSGQTNDTVASCNAYNRAGTTGTAIFGGWNISFNASAQALMPEGRYYDLNYTTMNATLCGNNTHFPLGASTANDAGVVDINVSIPEDAPATDINSTFDLTFNGKSS